MRSGCPSGKKRGRAAAGRDPEDHRAFGPDGVIFITWDEGSDPPYRPAHILTAILGPQVRPGAIDRKRHDHYGLERTLATGLGLAPLAHARTATPIATIWD